MRCQQLVRTIAQGLRWRSHGHLQQFVGVGRVALEPGHVDPPTVSGHQPLELDFSEQHGARVVPDDRVREQGRTSGVVWIRIHLCVWGGASNCSNKKRHARVPLV